jgi:hypothetical protein
MILLRSQFIQDVMPPVMSADVSQRDRFGTLTNCIRDLRFIRDIHDENSDLTSLVFLGSSIVD